MVGEQGGDKGNIEGKKGSREGRGSREGIRGALRGRGAERGTGEQGGG